MLKIRISKCLFLSVLFFSFHSSQAINRPRKYPLSTEISAILASNTAKKNYHGKEGYLRFCTFYFFGRLDTCFQRVSKALTKSVFSQLEWSGMYRGTVNDFYRELDLLSEEKYHGRAGYLAYAADHHNGNLFRAFTNASAVLSKQDFSKLSWGKAYYGTVDQHLTEFKELTSGNYTNLIGYMTYADRFHSGNMLKAFTNATSILTREQLNRLNWGRRYQGTTSDYTKERNQVFEDDYQGVDGYIKYADRFHNGDMTKTFANVSAVLTKEEFKKLQWGNKFLGDTEKHAIDREVLKNPIYRGIYGYVRFADDFYDGYMQLASINASALLSKQEFKELGWSGQFAGKTKDFLELRHFLLKPDTDEIYYAKWFGKFTGLDFAVNRFLRAKKYDPQSPLFKKIAKKVRLNFRSVVTSEELFRLGWDSSDARKRKRLSCDDLLNH